MMQELKNFKRITFTLKNGIQILILATKYVQTVSRTKATGFVATPWLLPKEVDLCSDEIAAIEIITDPHIVFGNATEMPDEQQS